MWLTGQDVIKSFLVKKRVQVLCSVVLYCTKRRQPKGYPSMLVRELCVRRSLNWFFSGRNENRTNSLQNGKLCQMASINCFQQVKIIYMDNG